MADEDQPSLLDQEDQAFAAVNPDSPLAPFLGGVAKGMVWDPIAQTWQLARHPIDSAVAIGSGLKAAAHDPMQAITNAYTDIKQGLQASPESAGETIGGFIGPGDVVKGARLITGLEDASRAGIWAGSKAATYDAGRAAQATAAQAADIPERDIYASTFNPEHGGGYWSPPESWGQDNPYAWITDKDAVTAPGAMEKLQQGTTRSLGDLLQHDRLYDAYPALRDAPVDVLDLGQGFKGGYSPSAGRFIVGPTSSAEDLRDTLLHEASHAVQSIEGMPGGSRPDLMGRRAADLADLQNDLSAPLEAQSRARQLAAALQAHAEANPNYRGVDAAYQNVAGEALARQPALVRPLEAAGERPFPFDPIQGTATNQDPRSWILTGRKGALYSRGAQGLEDFGITGEFNSPAPAGR